MKIDNKAIITALSASAIYLANGLCWHLIVFYMDGDISYYGSILFFLVHFLGLLLVKTFYVYHINEPSYIKHMVAIFMIAVNAVVVGSAVLAYKMMKKPNIRFQDDAIKNGRA